MNTQRLLALLAAASLPLVASAQENSEWTDLGSLQAWVDGGLKAVPAGGWEVVEGVIHRKGRGGDLFTAREFGDFELILEWKISPKGNSGIKYRVAKFGNRWLGPEYQVLDDEGHPDGKVGDDHTSASLYDILPADPEAKVMKAVGEWNETRIVVKGKTFRHFLNGKKVVEITVGSPEWRERFAKSKFKGVEGFGENAKGRIMLQDHGNEVWFRKVRIRDL